MAGWAVYERKVGQGSPPHNTSSVFAQFLSFMSSSTVWSKTVWLKPLCPLNFLRDPNIYFLYKNTAAVFRGPCAIPRHRTWNILGVYNSDI